MRSSVSLAKIRKKIEKTKKVVRLRKDIVTRASIVLTRLMQELGTLNKSLNARKNQYMSEAHKINEARASVRRQGIGVREDSLTYVKELWVGILREIKILEGKIESQKQVVNIAKTNLMVVEKLLEQQVIMFRKLLNEAEQKSLDEIGIRKYFERDIL